eukprot:gene3322-13352_t
MSQQSRLWSYGIGTPQSGSQFSQPHMPQLAGPKPPRQALGNLSGPSSQPSSGQHRTSPTMKPFAQTHFLNSQSQQKGSIKRFAHKAPGFQSKIVARQPQPALHPRRTSSPTTRYFQASDHSNFQPNNVCEQNRALQSQTKSQTGPLCNPVLMTQAAQMPPAVSSLDQIGPPQDDMLRTLKMSQMNQSDFQYLKSPEPLEMEVGILPGNQSSQSLNDRGSIDPELQLRLVKVQDELQRLSEPMKSIVDQVAGNESKLNSLVEVCSKLACSVENMLKILEDQRDAPKALLLQYSCSTQTDVPLICETQDRYVQYLDSPTRSFKAATCALEQGEMHRDVCLEAGPSPLDENEIGAPHVQQTERGGGRRSWRMTKMRVDEVMFEGPTDGHGNTSARESGGITCHRMQTLETEYFDDPSHPATSQVPLKADEGMPPNKLLQICDTQANNKQKTAAWSTAPQKHPTKGGPYAETKQFARQSNRAAGNGGTKASSSGGTDKTSNTAPDIINTPWLTKRKRDAPVITEVAEPAMSLQALVVHSSQQQGMPTIDVDHDDIARTVMERMLRHKSRSLRKRIHAKY